MIKYIFIEYILKPSLEVLFSELLNRVKKWYKTKRTSSKRLEVERGLEPLSFFIVETRRRKSRSAYALACGP